MGPRPRRPDRLPRRLRPRRGGRAGGVRCRRRALAARRDAGESPRVADDDRAQPRDRPHPPRPHARGEDPTARRTGHLGGRRARGQRSRTSGSSSSSRAATPHSRSTARSRSRYERSAGSERKRSPAPSSFPRRRWPSGSCARSERSRAAGIPFRVPPAHLLPDRLAAVLAVVYLIFNEGYGGRGDLASEAIRLGRALAELMPDEPEVHGLLALMLINDARREARFADGTVVLLRDQDRALWDLDQIGEGRAVLDRALALGGRGRYVVEADDRRPPRRRAPGLASARCALRRACPPDWLAGRRAQPGRRHSRSGPGRGRARSGGEPRPRALPLPALDASGAAPSARSRRRGPRCLRPRARGRPLRSRAPLSRAAAGRASNVSSARAERILTSCAGDPGGVRPHVRRHRPRRAPPRRPGAGRD